jgi:hypothetical protein
MNSIDRKLARCAREIEAAKPKVMSFSDFEALHHAFPDGTFKIKGAAQASRKTAEVGVARPLPVAAPPSPKFKVGDRVEIVAKHFCIAIGETATVRGVDCDGDLWVVTDVPHPQAVERGLCIGAAKARLIPSQPKADADGWIEWKGGKCPIPHAKSGGWMRRNRKGDEYISHFDASASICWSHAVPSDGDIVAYRLVK